MIICVRESSLPTLYDPTLNPLLPRRCARSLRCRGDTRFAESKTPIAKGKWNRALDTAQKTPLKGLRFENLEEAQAYLDRWGDSLGRYAQFHG